MGSRATLKMDGLQSAGGGTPDDDDTPSKCRPGPPQYTGTVSFSLCVAPGAILCLYFMAALVRRTWLSCSVASVAAVSSHGGVAQCWTPIFSDPTPARWLARALPDHSDPGSKAAPFLAKLFPASGSWVLPASGTAQIGW